MAENKHPMRVCPTARAALMTEPAWSDWYAARCIGELCARFKHCAGATPLDQVVEKALADIANATQMGYDATARIAAAVAGVEVAVRGAR